METDFQTVSISERPTKGDDCVNGYNDCVKGNTILYFLIIFKPGKLRTRFYVKVMPALVAILSNTLTNLL